MVILVAPVALYKKGSAFAYIKMGGKRAFSTPNFITRTDRLSNTDMGKYFFDKLPIIYFKEAKRAGNKHHKKGYSLRRLASATQNHSKRGQARKEKGWNLALMRNWKDTDKFILLARKEFMMTMQLNRSNKIFQDLAIIQRGIFQEDGHIKKYRCRFILKR